MVDISYRGLVASGLHMIGALLHVVHHPSSDLRGPRAGLILCKEEFAKEIDAKVFPGIQGGPLMHVIAGKAAALYEALQPGFKVYQQHIIDNAQALATALIANGFRLVSGGTDTHLMLINLGTEEEGGPSGKKMEEVWIKQELRQIKILFLLRLAVPLLPVE
jgi:glycine hydroxymethyltransferase